MNGAEFPKWCEGNPEEITRNAVQMAGQLDVDMDGADVDDCLQCRTNV
jgi:hypothetical protein